MENKQQPVIGIIFSTAIAAIPGIAKLVQSLFSKKRYTSQDIASSAQKEADAIAEWKKRAEEEKTAVAAAAAMKRKGR